MFFCLVALLKMDLGNLNMILDSHEVVARSSPEVLLLATYQLAGFLNRIFVLLVVCVFIHLCATAYMRDSEESSGGVGTDSTLFGA